MTVSSLVKIINGMVNNVEELCRRTETLSESMLAVRKNSIRLQMCPNITANDMFEAFT